MSTCLDTKFVWLCVRKMVLKSVVLQELMGYTNIHMQMNEGEKCLNKEKQTNKNKIKKIISSRKTERCHRTK